MEVTRAEILEGRLAPGQRLAARALTDTSGHSRSMVREALRRLGAEGVVVLTPNRGASVRQFSREEVADLYQVRHALEGLAARLAAERIGQGGNRGAFAAILDRSGPGKGMVFYRANQAFHAGIVAAAGNTQLRDVLDRMQTPILMIQVQHSMTEQRRDSSLTDHVVIAKAILAGNGSAAESAMRAHISRGREWVMALPNTAFGP